jgi:hypothetical protein
VLCKEIYVSLLFKTSSPFPQFFYTTYVGDLVFPATVVRCAFVGLALQSVVAIAVSPFVPRLNER